jgi:hypothetical protein
LLLAVFGEARSDAMKKLIASALVAATTAAALSACSSGDGSSSSVATGKEHPHHHHAVAGVHYTVAEQNAIEAAQSDLDLSGFSRAGLVHQLSSKSGHGFDKPTAVFAVNHIRVSHFSRAGLIYQLTSNAGGERFTRAQATYAANHVGR